MMRTIETTGVVTPEHTITLKLPDDFPEGECQVVVVASEAKPPKRAFSWASWPAHDLVMLNPNETFRREDMYGDDGR